MQTRIAGAFAASDEGREAEAILRSCVHCGFCNATCPTYRLLGDERDGPRGRIYLIKQFLEGQAVSRRTRLHLDRCLGCRACESVCPSGVQYGRLAEIGRVALDARVPRGWPDRARRRLLRLIFTNVGLTRALMATARILRPVMPEAWRRRVPPAPRRPTPWPSRNHARRVLMLDACVQRALAPEINAATAEVLDRLGIGVSASRSVACCGALSLHLGAREEALAHARRNIDAWWPDIEQGAEGLVVTASGCGLVVKDYGKLLAGDPRYAGKAAKVAALTVDPAELLEREDCSGLRLGKAIGVSVHTPCTLQHGVRRSVLLEDVLERLGFSVIAAEHPEICCGSAGTYSLLQPDLSNRLLQRKLADLAMGGDGPIVTANIGCLLHLRSGTRRPVRHWIELLATATADAGASASR